MSYSCSKFKKIISVSYLSTFRLQLLVNSLSSCVKFCSILEKHQFVLFFHVQVAVTCKQLTLLYQVLCSIFSKSVFNFFMLRLFSHIMAKEFASQNSNFHIITTYCAVQLQSFRKMDSLKYCQKVSESCAATVFLKIRGKWKLLNLTDSQLHCNVKCHMPRCRDQCRDCDIVTGL